MSRPIRRLLRRLVDSLPPLPRPWEPIQHVDTDLTTFRDFTDDEIESLRQILHSHGGDAQAALDEAEADEIFESSSDSDDEDWDDPDQSRICASMTETHPLKGPTREFNLDDVSDDVRILFTELYHTDEFQEADSFRRQIFLAVEYLRTDGVSFPWSAIGTLFGVSKATVTKHYQRYLAPRQKIGRPLCVDQASWEQFREFVLQRFGERSPVTTEDAILFLAEQFNVHLLPNTLRQKVRSDRELKLIKGIPMEKQRLECDITEIQSYFALLSENVDDVPAPFVFNLDESGFQDWADRRERTVIVPSTCSDDRIGMPIDRATKRSSLLLCIAADGTWLKPLLILPRKTIEKELLEEGINEQLAQFVYQENGFITTQLFTNWCEQVFFPELQQRRERYHYGGRAVLLMDGLTCHGSDDVEDLCLDNHCFIQFLPPHSSDQVQPCDIGIFGPMKANITRVNPAAELSKQSKQVVKILGALQTTLLPPTIIHAFAQAGIRSRYCDVHHCLICKVDPTGARCVRGTPGESGRGGDQLPMRTGRQRLPIP